MLTKQFMKAAVLSTATKLLKANNTVSTLEIKNQLREDEPDFYWNQITVSSIMSELHNENEFTYVDNGIYRIYSIPVLSPVLKAVKAKITTPSTRISRKKALELIKGNKGYFFTAIFTKQDGTERILNGQYLKNQKDNQLGYVLVRESRKMKIGEPAIRNINLQTLKKLKIRGSQYTIRN